MSDQRNGGIAWTDHSWNPISGCSRVSEGCRNCYAETVAGRFSGVGQPYHGLVTVADVTGQKRTKPLWNGEIKFSIERLADPIRWTRPRMVFVNSMSDLFHENVTNEQIAAIFGVMAASPTHTFQLLTKRPERMLEWFRWVEVAKDPGSGRFQSQAEFCRDAALHIHTWHAPDGSMPKNSPGSALLGYDTRWPLPNVWLGVSVENQDTANKRIPLLLETPAAVRWVSYEPAIGPVDFTMLRKEWDDGTKHTWDVLRGRGIYTGNGIVTGWGKERALDWIVVGGESGHGARPFDLAWARSVIEQTRGTGCRVFVKQLGAKPRGLGSDLPIRRHGGPPNYTHALDFRDRKGGDLAEWPEDIRVREWPELLV